MKVLSLLLLLLLNTAIFAANNPIDQRHQAMSPAKTAHPICDDHTFIRRLWLDTTGRLPSTFEVKRFLEDDSPEKRELAVDRVLDSHAFNNRWTFFLEDLFENQIVFTAFEARNQLHQYLRTQMRNGTGWDQIAHEILTFKGAISGDASKFVFWESHVQDSDFHLDKLDDQTAHITNTFLGIQTTCISCHDGKYHLEGINTYLTSKKRTDFWGMAAFLAATAQYLPQIPDDVENPFLDPNFVVSMVDTDEAGFSVGDGSLLVNSDYFNDGQYLAQSEGGLGMRPVRAGGLIEPVYMFTGEKPQPGETRREALARMITADRQFARSMTNRVWAQFFGTGFVNPLNGFDPLRLDATTAAAAGVAPQPNDIELMEMMTDLFIAGNYRFRPLIRSILLSDLYQLDYAALPDPGPDRIWPHWGGNRRVRRLEAQGIVDSIFGVLGVDPYLAVFGLESEGLKSSAWQMPGSIDPVPFFDETIIEPEALGFENVEALVERQRDVGNMLTLLGRGDRLLSIPPDNLTNIQTALSLLNDTMLTEMMSEDGASTYVNDLVQMLAVGQKTASEVVDELYLRVLIRPPTQAERSLAIEHISVDPKRVPDLMWALINMPEFIFR